MDWNYIWAFAQLLGGLGAFLLGFKLLSDGMSKVANKGLKALFAKTTDRPLVGVGIGTVSTAIMQSSSVTTVMVVGFVNAGIMTLPQATAVIMGSNIGTTITAQIVALQFIDILSVLMVLALVGAAMTLFCKNSKSKSIGMMLGGLGMVFVAMAVMKSSMEIFKHSNAFTQALTSINNPFLLLLLGVGVTALFQSSSAVTSLVITMVGTGLVIGSGGNSVLYVILGSNIGTCVTALISSIGASTNARRTSLIHLMFNVFGAVIFMIVLLCYKSFYADTFERWFTGYAGCEATQIAMFHTFFNVICTLLFVPFTKVFVKLSCLLIKDKTKQPIEVDYMDERLLNTPSIALSQLNKQIVVMADKAFNNLSLAFDTFITGDTTRSEDIFANTDTVEKIGNGMVDYLVKISARNIDLPEEETVNNMHHSINDISRINDFADNIVKYTDKAQRDGLLFSDDVKAQLVTMFNNIKELYDLSIKAFLSPNIASVKRVDDVEDKIDLNKKQLIDGHILRLNQGICQPESSGIFINLVSNLERAADHLTFIAHSTQNQA